MLFRSAARLSGGDFCESLVPLSSGINYVSDVIKIAINQTPNFQNLSQSKSTHSVVNRYFFLPPGKLEKIKGINTIQRLSEIKKLFFYFGEGSKIKKITAHGSRIGVFVVVAKNHKKTLELINHVYNTIKFRVDGKWLSGNPAFYKSL